MQSASGMRIAGSELQYQSFQTSISESRSFQLQYQAWTNIQTIRRLFFNELSSAKMGVIMRLASAAHSVWATFSSGASPRQPSGWPSSQPSSLPKFISGIILPIRCTNYSVLANSSIWHYMCAIASLSDKRIIVSEC